MSNAKASAAPPKQQALYDELVSRFAEVERKGATVPYTSINGNMSSYLYASGALALRLPPGDREQFLEKYQTKLFEAYGIVQKEYVTVPDSLLTNTDELQPYFAISYEYVKSLKPKPSKKRA